MCDIVPERNRSRKIVSALIMEESSVLQQVRCGYCNWLIARHCQDLLQHECFGDYNEDVDVLHVDENFVATIVRKQNMIESTEPLSPTQNINADNEFDEHLIVAVLDRPSLYNHRLNIKERSRLKKSVLWEEIKNIVGGDKSIKDLQKRWKYHRDCYIRAKRKLKEYVPSGSAATSSANIKCSYKFYELMRPLDDALETKSTVSSLLDKNEESLNQENYVASTFAPTQQSSQPNSTLFNTENTNYSNVESSNTETIEILTPMASPASETLMSTVKTTKRQKTHNQSELETALLDVLRTPEMDAVDGFLKMLEESLRRLPYRRRAIMEIKILEMVLEAE